MKIDVLCNDGSPLGVTSKTLWGDQFQIGIGGAEYALITMCEEWTKAGDAVRLYNNPREANVNFEQLNINNFHPNDERDVLIVFRSPTARAIPAKGLKVWWSCDQQTVGNFAEFAPYMDRIVCISPYHVEYFRSRYNISNAKVIDLPVRLDDFEGLKFSKIKNRIIFMSVPARGLDNLLRIYPYIRQEMPEVSVTITSDYRLWGVGHPSNEQFRSGWLRQENVRFLGAVTRGQLIEEEMQADILLYPCNYEELFCIAVAEAQCVGAYPVTSSIGALETTNMGTLIHLDANNPTHDRLYADTVLELLQDRNVLEIKRAKNKIEAKIRFSPKNILRQWSEVFK